MIIVYLNGDISFVEEEYEPDEVAFILDELPHSEWGNGPDVSWEVDFKNKTLIPHKNSSYEELESSPSVTPTPEPMEVLMSETKYQTMLLEFMNNMSMK